MPGAVERARKYVIQSNYEQYFLEWTCPKSCSDAGICDTTRGTCFCDLGRSGQDCSSMKKKTYSMTMFIFLQLILFSFLEFNCPGDGTCSNQGICDDSSGICKCDSGFEGQSCQGKMIKKKHFIHLEI